MPREHVQETVVHASAIKTPNAMKHRRLTVFVNSGTNLTLTQFIDSQFGPMIRELIGSSHTIGKFGSKQNKGICGPFSLGNFRNGNNHRR